MKNINLTKKSGKCFGAQNVTAFVGDEPLLPAITPDDAGKVLGVNAQGEIEAMVIPVPESKKYYSHALRISITTYGVIKCLIITDNNTPFTKKSLAQWLYDHNYKQKLSGYPCTVSPSYVINNNALSFLQSLNIPLDPTSSSDPDINIWGHKRVFTIDNGSIKINNQEIYENKTFTLDEDVVNEI